MTQDALISNHPKLTDGLCDGFRTPDLGWVGTQRPTEVDAEYFESGALVFSNWWAGPKEQAKALADALIQDTQAWLAVMTPAEDGDEFIPTVAVGYWEGDGDLALVGELSITEDLMPGTEWPEGFEATQALAKNLLFLASDGNDNYPDILLENLEEQPEELVADLVALVDNVKAP